MTQVPDYRSFGEVETPALPEGLRGRLVEPLGAERAAIESLAKAAA
ncbi:MAG TPA: hypothetical protein VFV36_11495 [Candidatus Methylomirabilis sp.]|nr:hypothetical protein [Candidatus Methylomirabilis sp.]